MTNNYLGHVLFICFVKKLLERQSDISVSEKLYDSEIVKWSKHFQGIYSFPTQEWRAWKLYAYFFIKVRTRAKIRNRYNQATHLTQGSNGKVSTSQLDRINESQ